VSYHAVRAYYEIYSKLRKEHLGLLFEICNDGGRMVDFGTAAQGDYFSITDTYDPLSNRRAFYDASHVLPSAMLETYVEKWPTPRIENFRFTIMQDTSTWSFEQRAEAKQLEEGRTPERISSDAAECSQRRVNERILDVSGKS
jgi:alpha-galactosidase